MLARPDRRLRVLAAALALWLWGLGAGLNPGPSHRSLSHVSGLPAPVEMDAPALSPMRECRGVALLGASSRGQSTHLAALVAAGPSGVVRRTEHGLRRSLHSRPGLYAGQPKDERQKFPEAQRTQPQHGWLFTPEWHGASGEGGHILWQSLLSKAPAVSLRPLCNHLKPCRDAPEPPLRRPSPWPGACKTVSRPGPPLPPAAGRRVAASQVALATSEAGGHQAGSRPDWPAPCRKAPDVAATHPRAC